MINFKGDKTVIPLVDPTLCTKIYVEVPDENAKMFDLRQVSIYSPTDTTTLGRIYKMISKAYPHMMIYVNVDSMLNGQIFRCGNCDNGKWQEYAKTQGMA